MMVSPLTVSILPISCRIALYFITLCESLHQLFLAFAALTILIESRFEAAILDMMRYIEGTDD
jgi:hypothetical protein